MYQAYFQDGQNIGEVEVVLDVARQVGLDSAVVREHLQAGTYSERLKTAQQEAHALGVSGVPTFVVGPAQIVGAQSPDVFVNMLRRVAERGLA
jgi:predicted DsbA family dithiol-disulfide isomerase